VSKRDYYDILQVERTATDQEIKSSYRKLALKFHPDRNPGDKAAEESFKEAAEAYAVLADSDKRHMYARFGHAGLGGAATSGFDPTVFTGFEDILGGLGDVFGLGDIFGGGRRRGGRTRGADRRYDLEISFEESARGAESTIQIPRSETCETCKGVGAAPGNEPIVCPACRGAGQIRHQQGFFTIARTCGQCRGVGRIIVKPCQTCRGAGRIQKPFPLARYSTRSYESKPRPEITRRVGQVVHPAESLGHRRWRRGPRPDGAAPGPAPARSLRQSARSWLRGRPADGRPLTALRAHLCDRQRANSDRARPGALPAHSLRAGGPAGCAP
jgi:curved DNA-binding protein CbpA